MDIKDVNTIFEESSDCLFESKCDVLVNTVNCYGVMGKGIPDMFKEYMCIRLIKSLLLTLLPRIIGDIHLK